MLSILLWCLGVSFSWGVYVYVCMISCALFGSLAYIGTPVGYKTALVQMVGGIEVKPIAISSGLLFCVLMLFRVGGVL